MSASLVGSEMCIRDSQKTLPLSESLRGPAPHPPAPEPAAARTPRPGHPPGAQGDPPTSPEFITR
eukprot:13456585-Alexandrium_andersonii.AAC.1